ncbi:MAG: hypothetical protein M3Y48_20260 [Actinomycetota bacterium]|nr:hypothetical protein [Actinomycetota bacterium]
MRRSARWALSSLDFCVHLVEPESDHPPAGVLTARCGQLLATVVHQHDQPPPGPPCERCRLIFLADFTARDTANPAEGVTDHHRAGAASATVRAPAGLALINAPSPPVGSSPGHRVSSGACQQKRNKPGTGTLE